MRSLPFVKPKELKIDSLFNVFVNSKSVSDFLGEGTERSFFVRFGWAEEKRCIQSNLDR
jgi:hypothetical protein